MSKTEAGAAAERALFDALNAIVRGDMKPWVDMFHDDGVMEYPFAPPGFPERLDGKAAIAAALKDYPERLALDRIERRAVHHCGDVMVVEFSCEGTAVATGNRYDQSYIGVVTLQDGKVKRYRDYWNPIVAIQALGGMDALLAFGQEKRKT